MDEVTPIKFLLSQNYPNPFSEKTVIKYCVAYKTRVQISVYNTEGEEIKKLVDEEKNPGTYEVEFSACHSRESMPDGKAGGTLAQGYYFYRMTAGDFTSEKKWLCINKLSGRFNMKNLIQTLFFFLLVTQICFAQAPVISVSPDSLSADLLSGKTSEQVLTIYNNGGSDLTFEINVKNNFESLFLNSMGDYSIISSTQPLESSELLFDDRKSYSGNIIPPGDIILFEKNEKLFEGNTLVGGLKILLITSGGMPSEIKDALLNFPDIEQVDIFDASSATPTLNQLLPYHTVITMDNTPYTDPVALGNVLADYVDAGRGLILTVATFASGWEIMGRLLDDEYFPFNIGYGPAGAASLGTFNPSHPIMQGVTAAYGDLLVDLTVANGAELIASWDTGWPFVATKGRNVTAVNIYITEPGGWTGDIPLILHNASFWAGSCAWLTAEPDNGTILAGSSMNITMKFDAAGLMGGEYNADIKITSNDPVTPELIVPANLSVTDAPAIYTETNSINFGEVFLGVSDTFYLEVINIGSHDLLIFSAVVQPAEYTVYPAFAGLNPGEKEIFTVTFSPQIVGNYPGTLTFNSNDPIYGSYILNISGQGVEPPVIVVSPDSLVVGVLPGSTRTKILTISNQGESDLYFNITDGFSSGNFALHFDGLDGYVNLVDANILGITNNTFTVESWIKVINYDGSDETVFGGSDPEPLHFVIRDQKPHMGFYLNDLPGNTLIEIDTWYHIAWRYQISNGEQAIFVNGQLDNSETGHSPYLHTDILKIGKADVYPTFNGIIDDFRIWDYARTQTEIQTDMNKELTGIEPGLSNYWNFNEGSGDTAYNKTSNAIHGTLFGGVQWTDISAPLMPGWFQISEDSGVCLPHTSMNIELLFDATELDTGDYYASIIVKSNDPVNPSLVVPIHMIVSTTVGVEDDLNNPLVFNLFQNYPNPFNPSTTIKYSIPEASKVKLTLFNLLGEVLKTLVNEEREAGNYSIELNAASLPSGVYFYQLKAGSFVETKKMLLLK